MASSLVDLVKINITSTGTGPLTLGAPVTGFRGTEALINGRDYSYSIQQGPNWEVGRGTWLSGSSQMVRQVLYSSNGGTAIVLKTGAQVSFVPVSADLDAVQLTADVLATAAEVQANADAVAVNTAAVQEIANNAGLTVSAATSAAQAAASAAAVAAAMNSSNAPFSNTYASNLPKGVLSVTIGGTAITGATVGEYPITGSGGSITGYSLTLVVTSATSAYVRVDTQGLGTGTTPPTLTNPSGATLPAGTTLTAVVGNIISDQRTYWVASADSSQILLYGNNGGSVATAPFGGTQLVLYSKSSVDASVALYTSGNIVGEDLVADYTLPVVVNGNLVGGLALTGEWVMPAVKVKAQATTGEDVGTGFKPLVAPDGLTSVFLIGYNANNELDFKPSPELIARLGVSGYLPVSTLRGAWGSDVFNVRRASASLNVATVRDRSNRAYDAKQRITGAQNTLVIDDANNPIEMLLFMGQSNAGEGGAGGVLYSSAAYPFSAHQLAGLTNGAAYGDAAISASAYTDLVQAADVAGAAGVRGQFPAKMVSFALQHYNAITGRREPGVICGTAWEGSQPLSSFFPSTPSHYNYENAIAIVTAAKAAAALYGRTIRVTLVFIQGEAGPTGRTTYGDTLGNGAGDLLDAILPGIQTAAGMASAPKVVLVQTNVLQGASENYACMGQYDVAVARADTVLAGPMYQHPFYDTAHLTPLGRMMQGGPVAEAIASLLDTGDWKPVQIASAVRSGVNIDLTYEGTIFDQGYSLAQDTDWVPTVSNLGFAPYSTGGATLSSATITGQKTVRLAFNTAPAAGTVVAYATGVNNSNTAWAFRLGNLMVQTARRDLFHALGFPVPQFVRHYAIRQEITVS